MAVLKFDQITAPDFTGVSSILKGANNSFISAGNYANKAIEDFLKSRQDLAKSELLTQLYKASPDEIISQGNKILFNDLNRDYLSRITPTDLEDLTKTQEGLRNQYKADKENLAFSNLARELANASGKELTSSNSGFFNTPERQENFNQLTPNKAIALLELERDKVTKYLNRQDKLNEIDRQLNRDKAFNSAYAELNQISPEVLLKNPNLEFIDPELIKNLDPKQLEILLARKDELLNTAKKDQDNKILKQYLDIFDQGTREGKYSSIDILNNPIYLSPKGKLSKEGTLALHQAETNYKNNILNKSAKDYLSKLDETARAQGYSSRISALGDNAIRNEFENLPNEVKAKVIELDPEFRSYNSNSQYTQLEEKPTGQTFIFDKNSPVNEVLNKAAQQSSSKQKETTSDTTSPSSIDWSSITPEDIETARAFIDQENINLANPLGKFNYPTKEINGKRIPNPARDEKLRNLINYIVNNKEYSFLKNFTPEEQRYIKFFGDIYSSSKDLPSEKLVFNTYIDPETGAVKPHLYKTNPEIRKAIEYYIDHKNDYTLTLPNPSVKTTTKVPTENKAASMLNEASPTTKGQKIVRSFTVDPEKLMDRGSDISKRIDITNRNYIQRMQQDDSRMEALARSFGTTRTQLEKLDSTNTSDTPKTPKQIIDNVINTIWESTDGAGKEFIESSIGDKNNLRHNLLKFITDVSKDGTPPELIESLLLGNISKNNPIWNYLTGSTFDLSSKKSEEFKKVNALVKAYKQHKNDRAKITKKYEQLKGLMDVLERARLHNDAASFKGNRGEQRHAAQLVSNYLRTNKEALKGVFSSYF